MSNLDVTLKSSKSKPNSAERGPELRSPRLVSNFCTKITPIKKESEKNKDLKMKHISHKKDHVM